MSYDRDIFTTKITEAFKQAFGTVANTSNLTSPEMLSALCEIAFFIGALAGDRDARFGHVVATAEPILENFEAGYKTEFTKV